MTCYHDCELVMAYGASQLNTLRLFAPDGDDIGWTRLQCWILSFGHLFVTTTRGRLLVAGHSDVGIYIYDNGETFPRPAPLQLIDGIETSFHDAIEIDGRDPILRF